MSEAPPTQTALDSLRPGFVVGGRFEVVRHVGEDELADFWAAKDTNSGKPIQLQLLKAGLIPAVHAAELRDACKRAAKLAHRNIVRTFGVGKTPRGELFVAGESVDGSRLSKLIAERARHAGPMSLRGAYNVIAHVCNALAFAQETMCHGTLRPSIVRVSKSGRVKVDGFGVGDVVLKTAGPRAFGDADYACFAPEVKAGESPTIKSDVFGLGAILYQLLTARSPATDFVPPSHVRDDVNMAIDEVLLRCLSLEPADRYEDAAEVRDALMPHLTEANSQPPVVDMGISVDIDLNSIAPPPAVMESIRAPAASATPFGGGPPPAPAPAPRPVGGPPPQVSAPRVSRENLAAELEKLSADRAARWMIARDKMDHGPFSARELVERLARGHFEAKAMTMNTDTGERKPLNQWPQFREFAAQRAHEATIDAEHAARVEAKTSHVKRSMAKTVGGLVLLGALAAGAIWYFVSLREGGDVQQEETVLADLFELGNIKIKGEAGLLEEPKRNRRRKGAARSSAAPGPAGASYEYAMNQPMELGDVTQGGGESRLTGSQIAAVMNKNINRLYKKCVVPELKAGGQLSTVQVKLAIGGNGSVLGSTVTSGSPTFRGCMVREVRKIRFPTFGAPRMGAQYRFNAN